MAPIERIEFLLKEYRNARLHSAEWQELVVLLNTLEAEEKEQLMVSHANLWEDAKAGALVSTADKVDWNQMFNTIINQQLPERRTPARRIHFLRRTFFKYAAIALLIAGAGVYVRNLLEKEKSIIGSTETIPSATDVRPGSNRAMLTLSTGKKVELNDGASEIIKDGALAITNANGQLMYKGGRSVSADGPQNTMSTPKGGQYQLTLSDGTRVWLNAASSLTYPITFTGNTREVHVTGEAYFEVARNKKPFKVKVNGSMIEVLGTSFNVNAYTDEQSMKTTLLEGRVKLTKNGSSTILAPGQQAEVNESVQLINNANVAQAVAWKNGYFQFDKNDVPSILRQISRWYDLDIVYQGKITNDLFSGKIERSLPLKSILHLLEQGNLKFKLDGKRLIMLQ